MRVGDVLARMGRFHGSDKTFRELHFLEKVQIVALKGRGSWDRVCFLQTHFLRKITPKKNSALAAKQNDTLRKTSCVYSGGCFF